MTAINNPSGSNLEGRGCGVELGLPMTDVSYPNSQTATTVSCLRPKTIGTPKLNKDKPRNVWNSINRILQLNHRSKANPLRDCSYQSDLANTFGTFFNEKIPKIRAMLATKGCTGVQFSPSHTPLKLHSFTPISGVKARKLVLSSPNKCCNLDPCLTTLVMLKNVFLPNL